MTPRFNLENVGIKAANLRDLPKLLAFIEAYYHFDRIPFDRKAIASGLAVLLHDQTIGRAWLILERQQPIGYLLLTFGFDLEFGGHQATLTDFYVSYRYRGRGVGRKALMEVEEFCRAHGVKALELQTTGRNSRALAFYKDQGFEAHDRIPMSKRIAPGRN